MMSEEKKSPVTFTKNDVEILHAKPSTMVFFQWYAIASVTAVLMAK